MSALGKVASLLFCIGRLGVIEDHRNCCNFVRKLCVLMIRNFGHHMSLCDLTRARLVSSLSISAIAPTVIALSPENQDCANFDRARSLAPKKYSAQMPITYILAFLASAESFNKSQLRRCELTPPIHSPPRTLVSSPILGFTYCC